MGLGRWLGLGVGFATIAACGGGVSLGSAGTGLGKDGDGGGSATAVAADCPTKDACGPAPLAASYACSDGSTGGPTGRCIEHLDGTCSWEIRPCPGPTQCFDSEAKLAAQYKTCSSTADCTVVTYQRNCCGSRRSTGVSKGSEAAVTACAESLAAALPDCECRLEPTDADDGSLDPGGATAGVACNAGVCQTSFQGTSCGTTVCTSSQTCCEGMPFTEPTCVEGTMCPISQRVHKKDIRYLTDDDRARLREELLRFPLATYRYKSESAEEREHLGFIIDDVAPSPAVVASQERVDMYGYQTMAVATLQVQAREIAELRREIADLKQKLRARR